MTYRVYKGKRKSNKKLMDNDNITASETRKRPRSRNDDLPPAACDQCRSRKVKCDRLQPQCSNCRKARVPCISSGASKRVNQTKQLQVLEPRLQGQRLDDVDQTLSTLTQLTQQIAARTYASSPKPSPNTPSIAQPTRASSLGDHNAILPSAKGNQCGMVADEGCLYTTVKLEHGGERIYPYPAALALINALSRELAKFLSERMEEGDSNADIVTKDPTLQAALRRQLDGYPYRTHCKQPIVTSDHGPITTPPQLLVELFVDGFLRNINISTPIFDEASLRRAIEAHYSGGILGENDAWALIFNNIVVLMLGLEAQAARAIQSNSRDMNDDLIPSFLRNCDRALADLEPFMRPSLINVRALLTLALVARQFYGNIMFERVCHAACQVGRTLGLPRSERRGNGADENSAERKRLFRVLYALDKQRVFASGQPCDLYSFDSDLVLAPSAEHELPGRKLINAFDHMMEIWEEIYLALYSSRAIASGKAYRAQQVRRIAQLIDGWHEQNHKFLEATFLDGTAELVNLQLELKYCYHVTQVLALCHDRQNERTQQQLRNHDRTCLKLIIEAGCLSAGAARIALLSRILGNYPIAAFIDLVAFHFNTLTKLGSPDAELESDFEILLTVCRRLQMLQHPNFSSVYFTHLHKGMTWALSILELLKTKPGDQFSQQPAYADAVSINQHYTESFMPAITSCPGIDLVQSEAELVDFGFGTSRLPTAPLNIHSRPEPYPMANQLEFNLETDFFQERFTPGD
ncbi:hypothetical protein F5Y13DRAFT_201587 [Hypoxylon sp. FL1857]|nr:hypothetical protein F5Y13DRAFT_201587 [Hypoxylon sp. FL1857]